MPAPGEPPESIVVDSFTGIRNTITPEKLKVGELEAAVNVDFDDVGQPHRRRGYNRKIAGAFHSLYRGSSRSLVVKDGVLGEFRPPAQWTTLGVDVGDRPLSYTEVADTIYFSSRNVRGKVTGDGVARPWGESDAGGTWLSPVDVPTENLGPVAGKLLGPPPLADEIEAYSGRIYMGVEKTLWATELYLYDYVDRTRAYLQLENDMTMIAAVDDGLYIGTEGGLIFLRGVLSQGMNFTQVTTSPVIRGSMVRVPADRIHPQARTQPKDAGMAIAFLAADGFYAAFKSGEVYNLTQGRVVFPDVAYGAALLRDDSGVSHYLVAADSGGGPGANARIGDHVEAEIRRFTGG